jgi:hypothetical protein
MSMSIRRVSRERQVRSYDFDLPWSHPNKAKAGQAKEGM